MFANCLKEVQQYTHPVIISRQYYNGIVEFGCGTFIILNDEGWILTAAHILNTLLAYNKQKAENISEPQCIKNYSYWWGFDGVSISTYICDEARDIAIGKIDNFNKDFFNTYPTLKNPNSEMLSGTSLCKLGFPFHEIGGTYSEEQSSFQLREGTLPMTFFPLDGICTRFIYRKDNRNNRDIKFVETSTPGLRGQSGGPIFDRNGHVWAMQSYTAHLPLGFNPSVYYGNEQVHEYQFLNVGCGTHVEEIISFLKDNNIKFQVSEG